MKINFTKQEYRKLIDLLSISDWIIHAHEIDIPEHSKHYHELIQRVYSYAKEMESEDLVTLSQDGIYDTNNEFDLESAVHYFVEEYNENTFWDELIHRLAVRDAVREVGEQAFQQLSGEDRIRIIIPHENKWDDEIENNGLENITIK